MSKKFIFLSCIIVPALVLASVAATFMLWAPGYANYLRTDRKWPVEWKTVSSPSIGTLKFQDFKIISKSLALEAPEAQLTLGLNGWHPVMRMDFSSPSLRLFSRFGPATFERGRWEGEFIGKKRMDRLTQWESAAVRFESNLSWEGRELKSFFISGEASPAMLETALPSNLKDISLPTESSRFEARYKDGRLEVLLNDRPLMNATWSFRT